MNKAESETSRHLRLRRERRFKKRAYIADDERWDRLNNIRDWDEVQEFGSFVEVVRANIEWAHEEADRPLYNWRY